MFALAIILSELDQLCYLNVCGNDIRCESVCEWESGCRDFRHCCQVRRQLIPTALVGVEVRVLFRFLRFFHFHPFSRGLLCVHTVSCLSRSYSIPRCSVRFCVNGLKNSTFQRDSRCPTFKRTVYLRICEFLLNHAQQRIIYLFFFFFHELEKKKIVRWKFPDIERHGCAYDRVPSGLHWLMANQG